MAKIKKITSVEQAVEAAAEKPITTVYPPNNTWIRCIKANMWDERFVRGWKYLFIGPITNPIDLDDAVIMDERGVFTAHYDAECFEVVRGSPLW